MNYFVVRESWTNKQRTLKVLSRPIENVMTARSELDFHISQRTKHFKERDFFLIMKEGY